MPLGRDFLAILAGAAIAGAAQAAVTLSQSTSTVVAAGNSVNCNNGQASSENSYYRVFRLADFGVSPPFLVDSVNVGIESAAGGGDATQTLTVRLYNGGDPGTPGSLAASSTTNIANQSGTTVTLAIPASISSGVLIVEVFSPDGTASGDSLLIGSNSAGQSAPSYIRAPACGVNAPTDLASLGYQNMHIVLTVTGRQSGVRVNDDFNGDGRSDVLWRNASSGENYLYFMNGTVISGEGYVRAVPDQSWKVAGIGDFDGDGRTDILWRNSSTGENYIYLMNGTTIAGEGYVRTVPDQSWQVAGVGDFDGDGKDDILWRNSASGENYLYPMNGLAVGPGEGYVRTVSDQNWKIAGIGDFDGDGRVDVLWRNGTTGDNYIYLMNGKSIAGEGYVRSVPDLNWKIAGVGDLNGDGKADIVWRNSVSGENYLYPMNGIAIVAGEGYIRSVADQTWKIAAIGDYDGDGKSDIFWRNSSSGDNYLYPMDGTTIKPAEGYLRAVPDQNWQVQR